jgi:hypothetical protein
MLTKIGSLLKPCSAGYLTAVVIPRAAVSLSKFPRKTITAATSCTMRCERVLTSVSSYSGPRI